EVRLRPSSGVGQDPEVQEHAEAQVDVIALNIFERSGQKEVSRVESWLHPSVDSGIDRTFVAGLVRDRFDDLELGGAVLGGWISGMTAASAQAGGETTQNRTGI